ncbi:MAG: winged helix DNA-binding domain-containing protein [Chitinophagaceae bacterium]
MTEKEIIQRRVINQQIAEARFTKPQQIVNYMVAMQAQVWDMAKWAIGLRLPGSIVDDIDDAFNKGTILRTHVMRPTWHFVTPADIRWLLKLTSPRVHAFNAPYYRKMELDGTVFSKSNRVIEKLLRGGKQMTRVAIKDELVKNKIHTNDIRFTLLLMYAELEGLICSGARVGNQFTYALMDERVEPGKSFVREEALGNLAKRYFITRGPATIHDFAWWSGLMVKDAKEGLAMNRSVFSTEKIKGKEFIFNPGDFEISSKSQTTFLLPDYDEYGISYKNREMIFNPRSKVLEGGGNHALIVEGVCSGAWKKEKTSIILTDAVKRNKQQQNKIQNAVKRYSQFFKIATK